MCRKGGPESDLLNIIWSHDGQGIAEFAVMLAVIRVLVVSTIRVVGSNANSVFPGRQVDSVDSGAGAFARV